MTIHSTSFSSVVEDTRFRRLSEDFDRLSPQYHGMFSMKAINHFQYHFTSSSHIAANLPGRSGRYW